MKKKISVFLHPAAVAMVLVLGLCGTAAAITGDLDGDNCVDWNDLDALTDSWLNTGCSAADWCGGADIDHSSKVDFNDFGLFALHWLESEFVDHNLVGWYMLDESGGVTAYDSSEYGYNGTLSGGASWEPAGGRYDGAFTEMMSGSLFPPRGYRDPEGQLHCGAGWKECRPSTTGFSLATAPAAAVTITGFNCI